MKDKEERGEGRKGEKRERGHLESTLCTVIR